MLKKKITHRLIVRTLYQIIESLPVPVIAAAFQESANQRGQSLTETGFESREVEFEQQFVLGANGKIGTAVSYSSGW
jgi:hypothetical protein